MGNIWDAVKRAAAPRDNADRLNAFKRAHGKNATKYLADHFGVSRRTAQKWVHDGEITKAGERGEELDAIVTDEMNVADALDNASAIDFGHIEVAYGTRDQGVRKVGFFSLREPVTTVVKQALQAIESGNHDDGEKLMGNAALMAYCISVGQTPDQLSNTLRVTGFRTGFHIV